MSRTKIILGFFLIAVISFMSFSLFGDQGWIALYKSYQQVKTLKNEVKNSEMLIDSLKNEIDRLKNDTAFIERIARERLGMARRNEKIFKFVEENH